MNTNRLMMQNEVARRTQFQSRVIANDPQAAYRVLSYGAT